MKKAVLFVLVLAGMQIANGQEIQNEVIGTSGSEDTISNVVINWTIGECLVEQFCNNYCLITQGFHQTLYKVLQIQESKYASLDVRIYPNPSTSLLNIDLSSQPPGKVFQLLLLNAEGKVLFQEELNSSEKAQICLDQFSAGIMILKISDSSQRISSSHQIIKINH